MSRNTFVAQYAVAEKGLDAMEAAIGPRHRVIFNPGAKMIRGATDAIARSLAGIACYDTGIDAAAYEIGRILLARDTMADLTVDDRAALAYDEIIRVAHAHMVA